VIEFIRRVLASVGMEYELGITYHRKTKTGEEKTLRTKKPRKGEGKNKELERVKDPENAK